MGFVDDDDEMCVARLLFTILGGVIKDLRTPNS